MTSETSVLERCAHAVMQHLGDDASYADCEAAVQAVINELFNPGKSALDVEGKVTAIDGKNNIYICGEDLIKNGMWQAMLSACLDGK